MRLNTHARVTRIEFTIAATTAYCCLAAFAPTTSHAWENLLKDPGFEAYTLNDAGYYQLPADAAWQEITFGRGSVQIDMNDWAAPKAMVAERKLGFTPATTGFEGEGPTQNTGFILLQQDIVDPTLFPADGKFYEAWVWLGGAGRDDESGSDQKKEAGGWEIIFYDNVDTANWRKAQPLEIHRMEMNYWGKPGSFVQVAGVGKIPVGTKGIRIRVTAKTWGMASNQGQRKTFATEVAIDNAHLAIIDEPNMLLNGDFEMDNRPLDFKGWDRPAAWPFARNTLKPEEINDAFGDPFDQPRHLPFAGGEHTYGFSTNGEGWVKDAFSFGQYADYNFPDKTPLLLTFNWIQGCQPGAEPQMRLIGSKVELVAEYVGKDGRLGAQSQWFDWPIPYGMGCVGRYDQNIGQPFSPRMLLNPPSGTQRVGVHVNFMVHAPYRDGFRPFNAAVDNFVLVPASKP